MVMQLLQQKNNIEKEIISIILCAGKGTRIAKKYSSIPKTLIRVKTFDDKPILEIILDTLVKIDDINQYWVVIGFLGKKINSYLTKLISIDQILKNKVKVINAIGEYEKGPLYSLLRVLSSEMINPNQFYLIIPGDTIFDYDIVEQATKLIKNHNSNRPIMFYQLINEMLLQNEHISGKTVRTLETSTVDENGTFIEVVEKINERIKVPNLKVKKVKQIIPIFALDYNFLLLLSNIAPKLDVNTVSDAINAIKSDYQIQACKIETNGKFFDIDTESDLKNLN